MAYSLRRFDGEEVVVREEHISAVIASAFELDGHPGSVVLMTDGGRLEVSDSMGLFSSLTKIDLLDGRRGLVNRSAVVSVAPSNFRSTRSDSRGSRIVLQGGHAVTSVVGMDQIGQVLGRSFA